MNSGTFPTTFHTFEAQNKVGIPLCFPLLSSPNFTFPQLFLVQTISPQLFQFTNFPTTFGHKFFYCSNWHLKLFKYQILILHRPNHASFTPGVEIRCASNIKHDHMSPRPASAMPASPVHAHPGYPSSGFASHQEYRLYPLELASFLNIFVTRVASSMPRTGLSRHQACQPW